MSANRLTTPSKTTNRNAVRRLVVASVEDCSSIGALIRTRGPQRGGCLAGGPCLQPWSREYQRPEDHGDPDSHPTKERSEQRSRTRSLVQVGGRVRAIEQGGQSGGSSRWNGGGIGGFGVGLAGA